MASFCELCGKHTEVSKKVIIEKSIMSVCLSCSKRGKPVESNNVSKNIGSPKVTNPVGYLSPKPASGPQQGSRNLYARKIRAPPKIKPPPLKKINWVDELILDPEFPSLIRNARSKKGLTHEQLGQKINEKVTLIKKIETGSIRPDEIIAKKLERFLGITLFINPNEENVEE